MNVPQSKITSKKFRIVPQRQNFLWELLNDVAWDALSCTTLRSAVVRHVEVSPRTNTWEILLLTQTALARETLQQAEHCIAQKAKVKRVTIYQDVIDMEAALEAHWQELLKRATASHPIARLYLLNAKRRVDGAHLFLEVQGELAGEILRAHHTREALEQAVQEVLGVPCRVTCTATDEAFDIPNEEDIHETMASYDVPSSETSRAATVQETSAAYVAQEKPVAEKIKSKAKVKTKAKTPTRAYYNNAYAHKAKKSKPWIRSLTGEVTEIRAIEGEMKNLTLEGHVSRLNAKEFQTGTCLLYFDLADRTNGISCKKFFKEREKETFVQAQEAMQEGMKIRAFGSVRFDTFQNDFVFFVDAIEPISEPLREDTAETPRIELHAHTHMSNMDAVVSAKDLIKTAARWGWPAVAITDHGVVQAFPDAAKAAKEYGIKVIYGMEGYLVQEDFEQKHANHIILLAKTPQGLRNLYQMISLSHLKYFHRQPRLPRRIIAEYREGLLIGSACEAGELIRAIVAGQSDDALRKIASFYDYLEIQPVGNNAFLKRSDKFPNIKTDDDLRAINLKVASLAKALDKPLVATGDVHFLNPEDAIYRAILMKGKGFDDAELQPPLYLRTTEDMLKEFAYLGKEEAYQAVVTTPRAIGESIERFEPIPEALYSPSIPGADEEIRAMAYAKARSLYGQNLPEVVEKRLQQELTPIIAHGFSVLYLIAQRLVKKSNDDGYLVGSRGSVGSSFVATMTNITEVNPLPPHWRCPHCLYSKFVTDGSIGCGYDLPNRECPVCGTPMIKDGHDIPFAVFLGFDGDKVPDIDLNFSGEYQPIAHKYTEELFGRDNVYRAGTIATVADKTAFGYVKKFFEEKNEKKHAAYIAQLAKGCMGVKRTTGQHPAGIMVVPRDMDVHFFTPIQRPADDRNSTTVTTHFDYHSISSRLVKLDILGHDDPTVIKMLEDLTHRDPKTIPFDDPATLKLFSSTEPIGLDPEILGATSGTFGIPEFRTSFTRQMIDDTHPACFSDLVRISGFSHGTDVWLGNAQDLIRSGKCNLKEAISARDDIMMYLIHKGIDPLLSFKTMESVRKGKGIPEKTVEILRQGGVPEWYIGACQKIKYMFPRAHATAYVMMAWRIAYCKVHYPLAFYAAYFSIRADEFDADIICEGKERVHEELKKLESKDNLDVKGKGLLAVLQLAWEMYLRGFGMKRVNLYESTADRFLIQDNDLLPPLGSLIGVGAAQARSVVEARKDGAFTSIEDLKRRTGLSKTGIEALRLHGCLVGLDESDQMALFV